MAELIKDEHKRRDAEIYLENRGVSVVSMSSLGDDALRGATKVA